MLPLEKVFSRFPNLTGNQRTELCRRRIVRYVNRAPIDLDFHLDIYYALGYLGTKNLFISYSSKKKGGE